MRLVSLILSLAMTTILAQPEVLRKTVSYVPSSQNVKYGCIFENLFNKERHPDSFPSNNLVIHWTKPLITSHDISYSMWKEGELASPAVEKVTESGGNADIIKELQDRGESYDVSYDKYLYAINQLINFEKIEMNGFKRYLSAISKLAPSPDWFSGFHDFDCVNPGSDTWYEEFVLAVYPYDAGTEEGDDYDAVNNPTNPPQPITQFTVDNIPQTTKVFLNKEGTDILPVATYTCTLSIDDGGMGVTQSPIFASLTRAPTVPLQTSSVQDKVQTDNKTGLIAGIILGLLLV